MKDRRKFMKLLGNVWRMVDCKQDPVSFMLFMIFASNYPSLWEGFHDCLRPNHMTTFRLTVTGVMWPNLCPSGTYWLPILEPQFLWFQKDKERGGWGHIPAVPCLASHAQEICSMSVTRFNCPYFYVFIKMELKIKFSEMFLNYETRKV